LREEVDITAQPLAKLSVISHNYPHVQLTLHPYLCEHVSGEPKLIECQQALWVEAGELRNYRFPPANESLLQEIVDRLGPSKGLTPSKGLSPQTNAQAPDDVP
jgi:mutator protein MutT